MTARIVGDQGVGNPVGRKLECRESRSLVAWSGLVDPHVDLHARIVGHIDRRQGSPPINGGQPTRVAMGQHVERATSSAVRQSLEERETVLADLPADFDIIVTDSRRHGPGGIRPLGRRQLADRRLHHAERPHKVGRRRPGRDQHLHRLAQPVIRWVVAKGKRHSVGCSGPDERRPPHTHGANRLRCGLQIL